MPASAEQKQQFRFYFQDDGTVFSDPDIDLIFDIVVQDNPTANSQLIMVLAKIAGIDSLRIHASRLTKYQQLQSMEDKTSIFKALTVMRQELVKDRDDLMKSAAGSSVRMAGTRRHKFWKDTPSA